MKSPCEVPWHGSVRHHIIHPKKPLLWHSWIFISSYGNESKFWIRYSPTLSKCGSSTYTCPVFGVIAGFSPMARSSPSLLPKSEQVLVSPVSRGRITFVKGVVLPQFARTRVFGSVDVGWLGWEKYGKYIGRFCLCLLSSLLQFVHVDVE